MTLTLLFLLSFRLFAQEKDLGRNLCLGEVREIKSKILDEIRILNLYLPENYDQEKSYPIIYLLDGSINEDFMHISGLVQFFTMQMSMPDCILAGIANVDRKRDFTFPTKIKELKDKYPTTGGSEKFIEFIEKELQPFIKANYKLNGETYLIGQSLGGLLATEILLKKPYLFANYLIISPSLWWDDESLLKSASGMLAKLDFTETKVFVAVGDEGKIMINDARKLVKIIQKSKKDQLKVSFLPLPRENHATILHQSIYDIFKILFPYKG